MGQAWLNGLFGSCPCWLLFWWPKGRNCCISQNLNSFFQKILKRVPSQKLGLICNFTLFSPPLISTSPRSLSLSLSSAFCSFSCCRFFFNFFMLFCFGVRFLESFPVCVNSFRGFYFSRWNLLPLFYFFCFCCFSIFVGSSKRHKTIFRQDSLIILQFKHFWIFDRKMLRKKLVISLALNRW